VIRMVIPSGLCYRLLLNDMVADRIPYVQTVSAFLDLISTEARSRYSTSCEMASITLGSGVLGYETDAAMRATIMYLRIASGVIRNQSGTGLAVAPG